MLPVANCFIMPPPQLKIGLGKWQHYHIDNIFSNAHPTERSHSADRPLSDFRLRSFKTAFHGAYYTIFSRFLLPTAKPFGHWGTISTSRLSSQREPPPLRSETPPLTKVLTSPYDTTAGRRAYHHGRRKERRDGDGCVRADEKKVSDDVRFSSPLAKPAA